MNRFANPLTDYSPQLEVFERDPKREFAAKPDSAVFNEDEELELASEFLEIADEQELEQFLGDLVNKVGRSLGKAVKSPVGRAVASVLGTVAKSALPIAGGALGGFVGGPIGAMLGSNLASAAGKALGLELEGLSPEDRELEACKQFVRFAAAAAKNALEAPSQADARTLAYHAAAEAARVHAPGLMNIAQVSMHYRPGPQDTGRWIRHHGLIVLLGV
jgi:hypothetical protein